MIRYIARASGVAARMIDGEMLLMSGRDSSLFSLNEVASLLWNAADGATPLDDIVASVICPSYEVDLATALQDARTLAADLALEGILLVSDSPMQEGAGPGAAPA